MNDIQRKLMPYVEARANDIVSEKESTYIRPLIATENEIVANIREDVLECMRELHKNEVFVGTNTINNPALMKKENGNKEK